MNEACLFAIDCAVAIGEHVLDWIHDIKTILSIWYGFAIKTFKSTFIASIIISIVFLVIFITLLACLGISFVGTVAIRHYILSHAPELWRLHKLDYTVSKNSLLLETAPQKQNSETFLTITEKNNPEIKLKSSFLEQAASLKMSLINNYVQGTIATSTLIIPSMVKKEIFPLGGGVSMEGLFKQKKPMFNARGVYDAKLQLVFLKEEIGRDISMVLESSILVSDDPDLPQSISTLDILFTTTTSFTFSSGEKIIAWPIQIIKMFFRLFFFVPLWMYETVEGMVYSDIFPSVNPSTEVAVVVSVYKNFEPPITLQSRLRAINFTLHQNSIDIKNKARLTRMNLYSSVQLTGISYYFSTYPVFTFSITTIILFSICVLIVAIIFIIIGFLAMSLYSRNKRYKSGIIYDGIEVEEYEEEEEEEKKNNDNFTLERRAMSFKSSLSSSINDMDLFGNTIDGGSSSSFHLYEVSSPLKKEKKSK